MNPPSCLSQQNYKQYYIVNVEVLAVTWTLYLLYKYPIVESISAWSKFLGTLSPSPFFSSPLKYSPPPLGFLPGRWVKDSVSQIYPTLFIQKRILLYPLSYPCIPLVCDAQCANSGCNFVSYQFYTSLSFIHFFCWTNYLLGFASNL